MERLRNYLGVPAPRPRVAFFECTSCEGCQLQLLNNEETLLDFLDLIEIVEFREIMSGESTSYDIAFVEGSVSCEEEIAHLQAIRRQTEVLVAFGSCACFGGVNQLRNRFADRNWSRERVYGEQRIPVTPLPEVLPVEAIVPVDVHIYGCPVRKEEVERIVCDLVVGKKVNHPKYPVCLECTGHGYICLYDLGEICLGPVTRAGCDAWCPAGRAGCQGCRGPAEVVNFEQLEQIIAKRNLSPERFLDCLECFGGFHGWADRLRQRCSFV